VKNLLTQKIGRNYSRIYKTVEKEDDIQLIESDLKDIRQKLLMKQNGVRKH